MSNKEEENSFLIYHKILFLVLLFFCAHSKAISQEYNITTFQELAQPSTPFVSGDILNINANIQSTSNIGNIFPNGGDYTVTTAIGATLSGQNFSGFNILSGTTLTMNNLAGTSFSGSNGSFITNSGNVNIDNCTISANQVTVSGGALRALDSGTTNISGTTFTENTAGNFGGGISSNLNDITIDTSTFTNNNARIGGAISNNQNLNISDTSFSTNSATSNGGALYGGAASLLTISNNSAFTGNTAFQGGAIYSSKDVGVIGSTFTNNSANQGGGAIYVGTTLTALNTMFTSNQSVLGGAIYSSIANATINIGISEINGISTYGFYNNTATQNGGAIYLSGGTSSATIKNVIFNGNTTTVQNSSGIIGGGAIYGNFGTTITVTDSIFQNNSSNSFGGAILSRNSLNILDSLFENNSTTYNGGAVRVTAGEALISKTTFQDNQAVGQSNSGGWGGAISTDGNVTMNIVNSLFQNNYAHKNGGALTTSLTMSIINTAFINNTADLNGGAININGPYLNLVATGADISSALYGNNGEYMGNVIFDGNTSVWGSEAINIQKKGSTIPIINLNAGNNGQIIMNDALNVTNGTNSTEIASETDIFVFNINDAVTIEDFTSNTNVAAPTDGVIILNNQIGGLNSQNTLINIYDGTLQMGQNGAFRDNVSLNMSGGTLNNQNGIVNQLNVSNLTVSENSIYKMDTDLTAQTADYIDMSGVFTETSGSILSIDSINILTAFSSTGILKIYFSNAKVDNGGGTYSSIADITEKNQYFITSNDALNLKVDQLSSISQADANGSYFNVEKIGSGGLPIAVYWTQSDIRNYSVTGNEIVSNWVTTTTDTNYMTGTELNINGNSQYNIVKDTTVSELPGIVIGSNNLSQILNIKNVQSWTGFGTTTTSGGAISALQSSSGVVTLDINTSTFSSNKGLNGGAIAFEGENSILLTSLIQNSTFSSNTANGTTASGGAIYSENASLTFYKDTFSNNSSTATANTANGGAISIESGSAIITETTFSNNSANSTNGSTAGGALYIGNSANVTINSADFTDNSIDGSVAQGGAIYNEGTLTLSEGTLTSNSATGATAQGGAIYNANDLTLTSTADTNITFSSNTAGSTANDIYQTATGSTAIDGSAGVVSIGSGFAGEGNIILSGNGEFILTSDSVNTDFTGTFTQTSGTTTVATNSFFSGSNTLTDGIINWQGNNSSLTPVNFLVSAGSLNIIENSYLKTSAASTLASGTLFIEAGSTYENNTPNLTLTAGSINGYNDSVQTTYGTYKNNVDVTISGDNSAFLGTFVQTADTANILDGTQLFANIDLQGGTMIFNGSANLDNTTFKSDTTTTSKTVELISSTDLSTLFTSIVNATNDNLAIIITNTSSTTSTIDYPDLQLGANITSLTINDNVIYNGDITLSGTSSLNLNAENYDINFLDNQITLNDTSNLNITGTQNVTFETNGVITGAGAVTKSDTGSLLLNSNANGVTGNFTQTAGSTVVTAVGSVFGGAKNIQSGSLSITSQNGIYYSDVSIGGNTQFTHTATNYTGGSLNSTVLTFNGDDATATFNGISGLDPDENPIKTNYSLSSIPTTISMTNNIVFNNADVYISENTYTDNTIYSFTNSIIDITTGTSETARSVVFDTLLTNNTALNFDVDFNQTSTGTIYLTADSLTANTSSATQTLLIGNIVIRNDHDNGSAPLSDPLEVQVLFDGLVFDSNQSETIAQISTTAYEYDVSVDDTTYQSIIFDVQNIATDESLNNMNILENTRYFIFTDGSQPDFYQIKNPLDPTADGEFIVLGYDSTDISYSTISGVLTSSTTNEKGSLFNMAGTTVLQVQDLTIQDTEKPDGVGSVISIGTPETPNANASAFVNNVAINNALSSGDGGAIYNNGGNVELTAVSIENSSSGADGGAISNVSGNLSLVNTTLNNNTAAGNGGAVNNLGDSFTVSGTTEFANNSSHNLGGAIYTSSDLTITSADTNNITFQNNTMNSGTADEQPNDIYMSNANVTLTGIGGNIEINSGLDGSGTLTHNGTNTLILGANSVNNQYVGTFTQSSGTTTVNGSFFGGSNTINNGTLNWNTTSVKPETASLVMNDGNININGNLTLNNANDSIKSEAVTNIASDALLAIQGGYVSLDTNNTTDPIYYDVFNGAVTLDGGTLDYNLVSNGLIQADNGSLNINSGGSLTLSDVTFAGSTQTSYIADSVNVLIANNSKLTLNSSNTTFIANENVQYNGTIDVRAGNFIYDKTTNGGFVALGGNVTFKDNSILTFNNDTDLIMSTTNVTVEDTAVINNQAGSIFLDGNDTFLGTINNSSTGNVLFDSSDVNTGTYRQTGGTLTLTNNSSLELNADSYVIGGDVNLDNSSINATNVSNSFNYDFLTLQNNSIFTSAQGLNIANNLSTSNSTIDMMNGTLNTSIINNMVVPSGSTAEFNIDLSPRTGLSDDFIINQLTTDSAGNAYISVDKFQFIDAIPLDREVIFNVFQPTNTVGNIIYTSSNSTTSTPLGNYQLYSLGEGSYVARLLAFNDQIYRGQVSMLAMYNQQLEVENILLNHLPLVGQPHLAMENANKYAALIPQFAPYQYSPKDGGLWFKSYATFERLFMTSNLNIGNNYYGTLIGADFPQTYIRDGWKFIPTAYVAYNGGHQTFSGVSMYQNGGQFGGMGTLVKDDFIFSAMGYLGGYQNDMNVAGKRDDTTNWFAGTAGKITYSFHPFKDIIIQPTGFVAYNSFGKQRWKSNFGSITMNYGMLNGISVAPGLNAILMKETWSLYFTTQYIFNINDRINGEAGNIGINGIEMRHGYIEYGFGATKKITDKLNSYFQILFREGGRRGVGLQFGIQYSLDDYKFKRFWELFKSR